MKSYILFLPIIFIIHDMEKIVGFEKFFKKNSWVFEKFPRITSAYKNFKTDAFARKRLHTRKNSCIFAV